VVVGKDRTIYWNTQRCVCVCVCVGDLDINKNNYVHLVS
jgi:hypothetical protein